MTTDYDGRLKKLRDTIEYSTNADEVLVAAQTAAALEQARVWADCRALVAKVAAEVIGQVGTAAGAVVDAARRFA